MYAAGWARAVIRASSRSIESKGAVAVAHPKPKPQDRSNAIEVAPRPLSRLDKSPGDAALERKKRVAELKTDLDQNIQIFLNEWQSETKLAILAAARPGDPKSHRNWFLALTGNLIWAGTAFLPAGGGVVIIMSVAGAVVGSGTLTEFEDQPGAPEDPANWIINAIHFGRNDMDQYFIGQSEQWARELASQEIATDIPTASETQLRLVWSKIFPCIPYASRAGVLYNEVKQNMEGMLADYNRQWREYKKVSSEVRRKRAITTDNLHGIPVFDKSFRVDPFTPDLGRHWVKFLNAHISKPPIPPMK